MIVDDDVETDAPEPRLVEPAPEPAAPESISPEPQPEPLEA